jgi:hypothetical protein
VPLPDLIHPKISTAISLGDQWEHLFTLKKTVGGSDAHFEELLKQTQVTECHGAGIDKHYRQIIAGSAGIEPVTAIVDSLNFVRLHETVGGVGVKISQGDTEKVV